MKHEEQWRTQNNETRRIVEDLATPHEAGCFQEDGANAPCSLLDRLDPTASE